MEPNFDTKPKLLAVLEELKPLEPIFHTPAFGKSLADFEKRMHEDYWETGASGKRYSRAYILNILAARAANPEELHWRTTDFFVREVGAENYLLTYTLTQDARMSRRATWWRRTAGGWQVLYHQGTLVQPA
jgi:hypothetical protein